MANMTLDDAVRLAAERHQAGRLVEARHLYIQVLHYQPKHADALNLLGVLLCQTGDAAEGERLLRRAIGERPDVVAYRNNLGAILREGGRLEEAAETFRAAVEQADWSAETFGNLGQVYGLLGRLDAAADAFRRALACDTAAQLRAQLLNDLGTVQRDSGDAAGAAENFRAALVAVPDHPIALQHLAYTLGLLGKSDEAVEVSRRALAAKKDSYEASATLGLELIKSGRIDDGVLALKKSLEVAPDQAGAALHLTHALHTHGKPDAAAQVIDRMLAIDAKFGPAHRIMADIRFLTGRLDDALRSLNAALEYDKAAPDNAHSARCFTRQFHPTQTPAEQSDDLHAWDRSFGLPLASKVRPHPNAADPDRRLKIGYVSPNFTNHCQAFFMKPVLAGHDARAVEVYCYSDVEKPHPITEAFQKLVPHWRRTHGRTHAQVAEQVRQDGIDVLVDLTMHMSETRLIAFAEKPAPVQVTWLAYPGSTGLSAIDYRLSDPYLDPPGMFEQFYVEKTVLLPDTFWCYDPLDEEPRPNALPMDASGRVTFGSFNNFAKVNDDLLRLWAKTMLAVPGSRLLLLTPAGRHREHVTRVMGEAGVAENRVEYIGRQSRGDYLNLYHRTDITLDTAPYNGHTTSLDSYWMGVPVVSLLGETVVGRAGFSQMTNLGLLEHLATDRDMYVRIAAELAGRPEQLRELRQTLRQRLRTSPLMDGPRFARGLEGAYRQMWQNWCATAGMSPDSAK